MKIFGLGKKIESEETKGCCKGSVLKKEEKSDLACACNGTASTSNTETSCCCGEEVEGICCIKVLGAGCKSCHEQFENAKKAVVELGLAIEVEYITDMEKIMAYGVMSMPAIVVNEQVVSMGKVLKSPEVIKLLGKLGF